MDLRLKLTNDSLKLVLEDSGGAILSESHISVDKNLSLELLPTVDLFLKKNDISLTEIEEVLLDSEISEPLTSYRIVKAVVDALNWSKKQIS